MNNTANYTTLSGAPCEFEVYPIGTNFKHVAGVYAFIKPAANGNWDVLYVGETGDLNERLNTALQRHQAWPNCRANGATHLAITGIGFSLEARLGLEGDLRHSLNPPCNRQ